MVWLQIRQEAMQHYFREIRVLLQDIVTHFNSENGQGLNVSHYIMFPNISCILSHLRYVLAANEMQLTLNHSD